LSLRFAALLRVYYYWRARQRGNLRDRVQHSCKRRAP